MLRLIKLALRVRICSLAFLLTFGGLMTVTLIECISLSHVHSTDFDPVLYFVVLLASVISTVFGVGTEFSDGTVRSKLICGVTKAKFYISQLIASVIITLMFLLAAMVPYVLVGWENFFQYFSDEILIRSAVLLLASALMLTLLAVLICTQVRNRAAALIACVAVGLLLALGSRQLVRSLRPPEYTAVYEITGYSEDMKLSEIIPNDQYVGGTARTLLHTAFKLNPIEGVSSAISLLRLEDYDIPRTMADIEAACDRVENSTDKYTWDPTFYRDRYLNNIYYPLWSGSLVLVLTAAGIVIFRKRNIY